MGGGEEDDVSGRTLCGPRDQSVVFSFSSVLRLVVHPSF